MPVIFNCLLIVKFIFKLIDVSIEQEQETEVQRPEHRGRDERDRVSGDST